jgi:hypothetical protein
MKDFTLDTYKKYLLAIQKNTSCFLRFDEYLLLDKKPQSFCLIRHDVDRMPGNALKMAELEYAMGIRASYYFRAKKKSFNSFVMKRIAAMNHEVGYHYESLSDMEGDIAMALKDFERNLEKFRKIAPIKTCAMHGRPLKPYDNRDIWRIPENHRFLKTQLQILGEVYLDIDYTDIAYINDTGRNWTSGKSNIRDNVDSKVSADFDSHYKLYHYLQYSPHQRLCFQIHPERWTDSCFKWYVQLFQDYMINLLKVVIGKVNIKR